MKIRGLPHPDAFVPTHPIVDEIFQLELLTPFILKCDSIEKSRLAASIVGVL